MRSIISINSDWLFGKDCADIPAALPEDWEAVSLPHTWNAQDGQDGGNDYFRGTCCYCRAIRKGDLPEAAKYILEIRGANSSADVYLNGQHLTHHDGGYSSWWVDLTGALREDNLLAILVDNAPNDRVYPQTADFTFYGGLYRDINILALPAAHFDPAAYGGLQVTPEVSGKDAKVMLLAHTQGLLTVDQIRVSILDGEGKEAVSAVMEDGKACLTLPDVHLWDGRRDPYLYTSVAEILRGGEVLDSVSVRFGCRSYEIDPERGFILNGREYPLRGVSRHQDWKGIGNALTPEHHRRDMEMIAELGANTIRLAHYQHDQVFYDLCDEYGMVVWAEIPYISSHMRTGRENTLSQLRELITQNYSHPSIAVWGISNEITMNGAKDPDLISNHRALNDLAHELDKTRPTTLACITMCGMDEEVVHLTDVVSYNHYFGWYGGDVADNGPWFDAFHKKYPNRAIGCSEYGCEALNWHNSSPRQGDYSEEYQAHYHEEMIRQFFTRKYLWATHVWNMFDFGADARAEGGENGQNHKGLVTFDRSYKKDAFYAYKAWLSDEPFVHICGKRYVDRAEDVTRVTVYSNLPEVELFANGMSVGRLKAEDHFFYFNVPLSGEVKLTAVAGDCRDESVIRRVEKMNMDYVLREQGAVLNWFDIKEIPGRCSLNDALGEVTATLRGKLFFIGLVARILFKMRRRDKVKKDEPKKDASMSLRFGAKEVKGLLKMIRGFSVLRLTSMLPMIGVGFTKEELLAMNKTLCGIRKPEPK